MGKTKSTKQSVPKPEKPSKDWLLQLKGLVDQVETWGREFGCVTRRIEKRLDDSEVGNCVTDGLLLQKDFARLLLEPLGRSVSGGGIADLCLMPTYDDVARLFVHRGTWRFEHVFPGAPRKNHVLNGRRPLFTKEAFREILEHMTRHAAQVG
jgi:hypothetical protein